MKSFQKRFCAFVVLSFYLLSPTASWACSSLVVGKDASATGRAMIARTADSGRSQSRKFIVVPAGFYKAGVEYTLIANTGFKFTFSHDSYKYTAVPNTTRRGLTSDGSLGTDATSKDAVPHWEDGYHFTHDSGGVNEKGLAVSGTTTSNFRSTSQTHADLGGSAVWTEPGMAKVLLAEAANCQEALAVVDKIAASGQGFGSEIIQIADGEEAWVIEAIGRYHYVASRCPDDSFTMIANATHHRFFDKSDTANFRSNFDPEAFAITNGFARYESDDQGNDRVNISLTYGGTNVNSVQASYRRWRGYTLLAPSQSSKIQVIPATDYKDGGRTYVDYIKPDKKISAMDITWLQRDRYAGTPFDSTYAPQYLNANGSEVVEGANISNVVTKSPANGPDPVDYIGNGTIAVRPIGHITHRFTHVFEVGGNLPPEIGARMWIGMAALETGVSLPFYGNITDTHPKHKYDITEPDSATTGQGINNVPVYNPDSAFLLFSRLGYEACADRVNYVKPIQEFWREYELKLYDDQINVIEPEILRLYNNVSPEASAEFATDYTIAESDKAFNAAIAIYEALIEHKATAPNTLFEVPAELASILEPAKLDSGSGSSSGCNYGAGILALSALAGLALLKRRQK